MAKAPSIIPVGEEVPAEVVMDMGVTAEPQANAAKKDPISVTDSKGVTHITLG